MVVHFGRVPVQVLLLVVALLLCGLTNWTAEGQSWHCHGSPSEPMKDGDVRRALHSKVLAEHRDDPSTLVLDELGLWYGHARVDVAVVNGNIHGFEIKSERDTLERLPEQERIYSMVLDRVTLVVGTSHVSKAIPMVPEWWGVKVATTGPRGAVYFREERAPRGNPQQDPVALAMLLWCEELEAALIRAGMGRGFIGKKRRVQAARLASALSLEALRKVVCDALKARSEWTRAGVYAPAVACLAS